MMTRRSEDGGEEGIGIMAKDLPARSVRLEAAAAATTAGVRAKLWSNPPPRVHAHLK
jgi:hypothetical protein